MKKLLLIVLIFVCSIGLTACGAEEDMLGISFDQKGNEAELKQYDTKNPVVAMYIEDYGSIVIELYPEIAPNTANNFISLVKSGFYDNNTFHRLVPGFVLQGGDPNGMGTGGPGYTIKGEFSANGVENNLKHTKWVVSMARSQDYDSAYVHIATETDKRVQEFKEREAKNNIYTIGRYGAWTYCSMEDCMVAAKKLAEKLV